MAVSLYTVYSTVGVQRFLYGSRALAKIKWWEGTIVYQIYPRSFQDSDGDGVGDIAGITSRLDYIKELGVEAVWLSPIYESPMVDFGYDVADFTEIDTLFGTMDDFNELIEQAHKRDMKVLMDFIPNHTSDKHVWFELSRKAKRGANNPYKDYYIWHDGRKAKDGTLLPPNNWVGVFGGSMWTYDETRKQFYLHQFTKEQPDLNFRNPEVRREIEEVIAFWLKKGVDGFRVDAVRHIFETKELHRFEKPSGDKQFTPDQYEFYSHTLTRNLPEVHELISTWRDILNAYEYKMDKDLFMVVEVFEEEGTDEQMKYYASGAHMPFNFQLQKMNTTCDGSCVARLVYHWLNKMPEDSVANWVLGSHDVPRIADKMGVNMVNTMNMLLLLLPGVPFTYYGEEIGMQGVKVAFEDTQDPFGINMGQDRYEQFSRDPCRSPMQWSYAANAGFSNAPKTWLPVHSNYKENNVEVQQRDPQSHLNFYRRLAKLRRDIAFIRGDLDYAIVNHEVFSFIRFENGNIAYLIAANVGETEVVENFRKYEGKFPPGRGFVPQKGFVVMDTHAGNGSYVIENDFIQLSKVKLIPGQGLVLRFWPTF
ncbi:hypothetical protein CAPTEDRAFT_178960 [Capitella teleta]|uniref:Glycosyl hydrolase family 13 catalytic domain-containing protein n=1 Tax=Capitella teleta TaxID=283909 RepID=R7UXZ2_CAPTE|nr:hypothetical protein CAPTEDRAFT_178960 [Capitella teleta]|eukprot:ELU08812.1 hypothetical protein CAPTEDRAFT_178960 [Capitella teleta]